MSGPAMSRHLRVLLHAGILSDERGSNDARIRIFRLRPDSLVAVQAWLDQVQAHWDEQLQAFKRHVEGGIAMTSTTTSVSVTVGPDTAFTAFTEELDAWWVRGPVNYFDASRAVRMHCEPGVGGRLMEVYDDATGEGLELGRITIWNPPARLAWKSSVDDVEIVVQFEAAGSGTDITVLATIPDDGMDRGGTAWVRVVPKWFPAWCARRESVSPHQPELARLGVALSYDRPAAAARWLASVFGLESPDPLPTAADPLPPGEHGHPWIEFLSETVP